MTGPDEIVQELKQLLDDYTDDAVTNPVAHYRLSLGFEPESDSTRVMTALCEEGLLVRQESVLRDENQARSTMEADEVLNWIADRFPGIKVKVNYWLPFRRRTGQIDAAYQFARCYFRGRRHEDHDWKKDGF